MKNTAFKRLMSLLLVVVMIIGMLPTVFATEASEGSSTDEVITSSSDPPVENNVDTTEETTNPVETIVVTEAAVEATTEASEETTANTESSEDSTEASSESADETTAPAETTAATEDSEANPQTPTETTDETEVPTETTVETEAPTETTVETEAPTDTTDESETPTEAPTEEAANPTTESTEATYPVSDPTADVESEWEMEATFADVELTEDLVANFLAIAESQLGYKESTKNFIIDDNGEMKGYTRYGDWWANGYEYGDWCAMFVSFCLYYSGIEIVPLSANCEEWVQIMQAADGLTAWYDADDESYAPEPGDIIFYDLNGEGTADHVGIIKEISKDGTFLVYEGNYDDSVAVVERENNQSVLGFIPVSLIVYYSATVPLTTLVEDNSCRIYWLNGKNALYSYSYKDAIGTTHSGSFEALTTYTLNGVQAYCIEPVKTHGSAYTQSSSVTAWNTELSANQRQAIALALAYGYPNTTHADSSTSGAAEKYQNLAYYQGKTTLAQWKKAEKIAATQLIIWEIVTGARQATPPYKCTNTWLIDAFFYDAATNPYGDWSDWYTLKQTYDEISTSLANHGIPSFCSDSASGATTYKLIANSSGNYTLTLTDTNGVLSGYSFSSSISGLTMSRSGNTLTITATPAAAATLANSTVTISATGSSISIDPSKAVAVWSCDNGSNKQSIVTLATSPSAMTAYFKLSADAQFDATIAKVSSDNSGSLSGYKIKLWNSTTNQSWNAISDENGNFVNIADNSTTFKLTPGTYDILEFLPDSNGDGNPDSYPYEVTFATYTGSSLNGYTHYYSDNGVLKQPNWTTQSTGTAGTITLDVSSSGSKLYSYSSWPSGNYYQARLNKVSINLTSSQSIKITVSNAPQPGTATMKKTNSDNSDNVSNYAFKLYQNGTGLAWYGKSNNYGNIYQTYYGMDNGSEVYYGSYGDKLATPATRTYSFEGLKDGTYSFYEILSEYGKGSVFPNSITIKVTNGGSTVYNKTFDSSDIKEDSSGNAYISSIQITGLSGGGVMTIEINNEDVPGTATIKKTSTSGNVNGYAFKLYQSGTGLAWYGKSNNYGNIYQTYYGKNDGSEVYYGSYDEPLATPTLNRTYSFEGLKDGTYSLFEILSEYGKGSVFPDSITIKVTNGGSTVYNQTFDSSSIEESGGNAVISNIEITGLSGGGVMTITINNKPIAGKHTMVKISDTNDVNGYAFRLSQTDTGLVWCGRSNNEGNIYQTYYGYDDGSEVYYGSANEPYAVPSERSYTFDELTDGTYSFSEILSVKGKGNSFPESITITVTNGSNTVFSQVFDSSSITKDEDGNAVIPAVNITGLDDGGSLNITIKNVSTSQPVTIVKTAFCDEDVYDQISGNTLYSLAGAKYDLYIYNSSGVAEFKETLITDANGTATSSGYYECGTTGYLIETEAPPGYILDDESKWDFVIDSAETTVVNVTDEPVFDPGWIPIQKINANTTVAQGNTSFEGAIFKWEYFTNYNCSGEPERVWYFTTDANGRHDYDADHLINTDKYPSNSLYVDSDGIPALPLGSVRITEVVAPLGYTAINTPLTATIKQNGNDAKFAFTADTVINVTSDGSYGVTEDDDITTWASITIQKATANQENVFHDDTINFAGCEFTVYNNSGNPVYVGDNVAQPGEACYVLTVDANGYAATGDIFPIGSYTIKETKGNEYYLCNTEWSASFDVTGSETVPFAFTCENTEVRGNLLLYKVEENTNTNTSDTVAPSDDAIVLAGATYKFWYPNGDVLGEYTTDENGMIQIDDLPYGVGYKYQEIIAPEGFELDEEVYSFNITENGTTITRTREDVPILGSIKVKKVDADGNTLTGIPFLLEFSLDDGETWSPVTAHSTRDIYRYYCSRCGNFAMQYLVAGGTRMCGICRSTLTQRPYKTVILYTLGGCTSEGLQDGILYTDENGECIFTGLRVNSQVGNIQYRLTELATENGYTLLADYAFLGELPYTFDDNTTSVDIVVEVVNNVVFEFPATGENDLFMVTFGAILAVFAIAMFVMVAAPTVFNGNPAVNKKSKTKRSKQS